jgi:predicted N-acyltransferase
MSFSFSISTSIKNIDKALWQGMLETAPPFLEYDFLLALEQSSSVCDEAGWVPTFMTIFSDDVPVAYIPMYEKHHSYGEYVFDHAWANAYHQHQIDYYPKLVIAVPFTPVTANKLICEQSHQSKDIWVYALEAIKTYCQQQGFSSAHWLYAKPNQAVDASKFGFNERLSVQFQWRNKDYKDFEHYLSCFTSRKRKDIRKERRKIYDQGVTIRSLHGDNISSDDMAFFYDCYRVTYLKRSGHTGYLTKSFFEQIYASLRANLFLVIASSQGRPIASALYLFNSSGLFGRYWGAIQDIDGLHFECCYYAGIEFAIANKLPLFNPGTQGEHKILRGFEPVYCHSVHYLVEPAFHAAVENFVQQERHGIKQYFEQTCAIVPFKKTESGNSGSSQVTIEKKTGNL